jgi:hypothetical protein
MWVTDKDFSFSFFKAAMTKHLHMSPIFEKNIKFGQDINSKRILKKGFQINRELDNS